MQHYASQTPRIGKIKGKMLRHAMHVEVLGITGEHTTMPKRQSDTIGYRRWLPFGASEGVNDQNRPEADPLAHEVQEGIPPTVDDIQAVDVWVTMREYAVLYGYTSRVSTFYEDDVPKAQREQAGERIGLVREMLKYGALKGCANKRYIGGNSRSTVNATITLNSIRAMTRTLRANHCDFITEIISGTPNEGTEPVERAWLVFCHSDMEHDIRGLPGFTKVADYGNHMKSVHKCEIGTVETLRFLISPELKSYEKAGATITTANQFLSGGDSNGASTKADVYPVIVVGKYAWADLMLRGDESMMTIDIPASRQEKSDPIGQKGFIGGAWYQAPFIQNDGWMGVIECAASAL